MLCYVVSAVEEGEASGMGWVGWSHREKASGQAAGVAGTGVDHE